MVNILLIYPGGQYIFPRNPDGRVIPLYHSIVGRRFVFDVDPVSGNASTSKHFTPHLWELLDRMPRDQWPVLLRGGNGFGNEPVTPEARWRGLPYLFRLRLTSDVKRMIERFLFHIERTDAGRGWQAKRAHYGSWAGAASAPRLCYGGA